MSVTLVVRTCGLKWVWSKKHNYYMELIWCDTNLCDLILPCIIIHTIAALRYTDVLEI